MTRDKDGPRVLPVEAVSASTPTRTPRAFDLEPDAPTKGSTGVKIEDAPEMELDLNGAAPAESVPREPALFSWSTLFWSALWLLVTASLGDSAYTLVLSLQQKSPLAAQIALGLIGIVVLGVLGFLAREFFAILRMRKVAKLRERATPLLAAPEKGAMKAFVVALRDFYARDPAAAAGRSEIDRALDELHDPRTLLVIAERALLTAKDKAARQAISQAAQRVSVVTALSPRAIVDVVFVLVQSIGLIRRISALYGGRASGFGLLRLSARVVSHLAVTGGMAVADSFLSQIVGAGLAARLSAKLGEGVLNGVLTARVGIAATLLCRPLPFIEKPPILLSEVVKISITQ
jgi:putative membrane protein